jgi:hypothetical protein
MAILAVGLLLLSLAGSATAGDLPPAEKVLAKFTEAIGGDALDKVENMSAELKFEMPANGVYATAHEYWEKPDRHYIRIDLAASDVPDYEAGVVDGVAWQSHPLSGTRKLAGDDERQGLRGATLDPFANWEKLFDTAETVGEEVIREKPCYKVVFTPAEGKTLNAYFEKDTGLLLREELVGATGSKATTDLDDWEETQGIQSARTVKVRGPASYTLKFTSVTYDVDDIPADAFELPATLKAVAP